jgi:septation ring formation regulator EzrA
MTDTRRFADALASYEGLHRTMIDISRRTDEKRKADLLVQRRRIPDMLAHLRHSAAELAKNGFDLARFESQLSELRHILATHQATWSVVKLDDSAGYRQSVDNVIRTVEAFLAWCKAELARIA